LYLSVRDEPYIAVGCERDEERSMSVSTGSPGLAGTTQPERPAGLGAARTWLWATPVRQALVITAVWRVVLALAGILAYWVLPAGKFTSFSLIRVEGWPRNPLTVALDACVRNDAVWFGRIALHGYSYDPHHNSSIGFFPLFPALMKLGSLVVGDVFVAGIILTNLGLFLAVVLLARWLDDRGLGERAPLVTACLLLFPWSMFYGVMYSESLHLLLVLAIFISYEHRRWMIASAGMFALFLLHPLSIVMLPCLAVLWWQMRPSGWYPRLPFIAGLAGTGSFMLYQAVRFGDPLAYIQTEALPPWSHTLKQALADLSLRGQPGIPPWYLALMLAIGVLFLSLVPLVYRRFGPAYALFVALTVLSRATTGLTSMDRHVIVAFPVFAAIAVSRGPRFLVALFTFEFWLLLFITMAFEAGWAVY